jgi:transcriptional regulator with XRE-family HTH domain
MRQITLKMARELSGFSVEDISLVCGITIEDVNAYERDTRKMPFDLARVAKRLFHIKIEQIHIGLDSDYAKNNA